MDKRLAILLIPLLALACWKKQSHEITPPETPHYRLQGRVVDRDTRKGISSVQVMLSPAYQLYECEDSDVQVETDSLGGFRFDSVCPGFYSIFLRRDSVVTTEIRFELRHGDTTLVLDSPRVLFAELRYAREPLLGLTWRSGDSLAFISEWSSDLYPGETFYRVYEGSLFSGFRALGTQKFFRELPKMQGLCHADSFYYTFSGGLDQPTMNVIWQETGELTSQLRAPHRLNDLAFDGTLFWATTTRSSIIKWNVTKPYPIEEFPSPLPHPRGIAWDGTSVWTSDEGPFGRARLFHLDENGRVRETFCPASRNDQGEWHPLGLEFLTFDSHGNLWAIALDHDQKRGLFLLDLSHVSDGSLLSQGG